MEKTCNGVFQGGGVRAIGQAGALKAFEEEGYKFQRVYGTSAGALIATLLAVGYSAEEIKVLSEQVNLAKFRKGSIVFLIPRFFKRFGAFSPHNFEKWLYPLLEAKGKTTFADVKYTKADGTQDYRVRMVCVDVTTKRLVTLPDDLDRFGIDKDSFSLSRAVRMSIGIPLYYEPVKLLDKNEVAHYIIDGGMLSNFPIWLIDKTDKNPTFGFKYVSDESLATKKLKYLKLNEFVANLIDCTMESCASQCCVRQEMLKEKTVEISIVVEKKGKRINLSPTNFKINDEQKAQLFKNGYEAGKILLNKLKE